MAIWLLASQPALVCRVMVTIQQPLFYPVSRKAEARRHQAVRHPVAVQVLHRAVHPRVVLHPAVLHRAVRPQVVRLRAHRPVHQAVPVRPALQVAVRVFVIGMGRERGRFVRIRMAVGVMKMVRAVLVNKPVKARERIVLAA